MNLDAVFGPFPQPNTERLALREPRSADAEPLFAVLGDEKVTEFYDDEVFVGVPQALEQIEAWAAGFRRDDACVGELPAERLERSSGPVATMGSVPGISELE